MDKKHKNIPPYKDRISTQDLAEMLGVCKKTLYRWEAAKKLPQALRDPMNNYRYYNNTDLKKIEKITGRRLRQ